MLWRSWQPARLLARALEPLFRRLSVDEEWLRAVQAAAARGPLVYVLRNVSILDYLALAHLTHRLDLPRVEFVNVLPAAYGPLGAPNGGGPERSLARTIEAGHSAALFLKRPPSRLGPAARGKRLADTMLETLLELQTTRPDREIMMMPQAFVWTQRPERRGFSWLDTVFGPADYPGQLRASAQFLINFANGQLRTGEPLSLREFLASPHGQGGGETRVHRLNYLLLRKLERERRSIVGPAQKSPERVRSEVVRSPRLQAVIGELAGPSREGRRLLTAKARKMLERMQTLPDTETQRTMALGIETLMERVFSGVDVDREGLERLREATQKGPVILLPSHKSHIDYLVMSTILLRSAIQLPAIASGENLAFFPAGPVLRRGGAFFIRRSFKNDRLYTALVDAYVRRLLRDGWMIEFFLEGGRSRTGKLLPPRTGLLAMVVEAALDLEGQTVTFMPASIGYERLMEEGAFERELSGKQKSSEGAGSLLKAGGLLWDRWGRMNIQFGRPIELGPVREAVGATTLPLGPEQLRAVVTRLAHLVLSEINRVTALTPGALVAMVLLSRGRRGVSYADLIDHCQRVATMMLTRGARATPSLMAPGSAQIRIRAIQEVLALYLKGGLLRQHLPGEGLTEQKKRGPARLSTDPEALFTLPDDKRLRLDLAKNTVVHLLVDRAMLGVALLAPSDEAVPFTSLAQLPDGAVPAPGRGGATLPLFVLRERVQSLSRLFKYEFTFRVGLSFDEIFDDLLVELERAGELRLVDDLVSCGPGHDGLSGEQWLAFYASVLRNFIESYRIAARSLRLLLRGPMAQRELSGRALRVGERMFLEGAIERAEAVSRPVIDNALAAFRDQGYLAREGKELALSPSFASEEAIGAIEARVAEFLRTRGDGSEW